MLCDGFAGQGACDGLSLGQQLFLSSQGKMSIFWFMHLCENERAFKNGNTEKSLPTEVSAMCQPHLWQLWQQGTALNGLSLDLCVQVLRGDLPVGGN